MKKFILYSITVLVIAFILPVKTQAIPAFARKYGYNCNMCHTGFTKLNDFGQRFRDNGYQIPGQEGKEKNVFDLAPPLALRLSFGHTLYNNDEGTASSFNLYGLDLLAAGVLHKNISFLFIYTPRIDEPSSIFSGLDSINSNPSQFGRLESANLVFSNIIKDALNIRIGRFEPGYHIISSKRTYYLFQPYEVYLMTSPRNNYTFDDNQIGIEATGHFQGGFKYAAGFTNGTGASADNNNYKDLYLSMTQTLGKGDGQSAGQRIGLFGYYGWQPLTLPGTVIATNGQTNGSDNKTFYRLGVSASANWKTLNMQMIYYLGSDNKALNTLDATKNYKFNGGFVELSYAGFLNNRLIASAMYNWVRPPSYDSDSEVNAYSALCRYYLGDWSAINIAIHAEYTHRITGGATKNKENVFALALDFAF
ncbi:MAG: uncharacterized protein H6Q21_206 [Bacteroidetes bacterium]|nr:uncharacterized protein [Bacteroidota bacterium]